MSTEENAHESDFLIERLRQARQVPAVLKTKLATLRSTHPDILVFAFEGIDDKGVYYHWIKRVQPEFIYEPFVCNGKRQVLEFKQSLDCDLGGLDRGVYFFVDRDFDDLRGVQQDESIYMTATYSFKNHLVCETVLDELLKNELHCHGEPVCRHLVIEAFKSQYSEFLKITREVNKRIYFARRCSINEVKKVTWRAGHLANIQLMTVSPVDVLPESLVKLEREPLAPEYAEHEPSFNGLDSRMRFRGKFALLLFRKWLGLLVADRKSPESILFPGLDREGLVVRDVPTLDSMAARAIMPPCLADFIRSIVFPPAAPCSGSS